VTKGSTIPCRLAFLPGARARNHTIGECHHVSPAGDSRATTADLSSSAVSLTG